MFDSLIDVLNLFKSTDIYKKYFINWLAGPETYEDKDIQKFLGEKIIIVWYANGTVKIGTKDDEGTCVDSDFKALGIERLRVADMSVSPVMIK
jgi:choline dehydrogenase-like flavoprotein